MKGANRKRFSMQDFKVANQVPELRSRGRESIGTKMWFSGAWLVMRADVLTAWLKYTADE